MVRKKIQKKGGCCIYEIGFTTTPFRQVRPKKRITSMTIILFSRGPSKTSFEIKKQHVTVMKRSSK